MIILEKKARAFSGKIEFLISYKYTTLAFTSISTFVIFSFIISKCACFIAIPQSFMICFIWDTLNFRQVLALSSHFQLIPTRFNNICTATLFPYHLDEWMSNFQQTNSSILVQMVLYFFPKFKGNFVWELQIKFIC